ncbi:MauE/DoxX family redox-associated membrane protein [Sphingobacterium yanglingense]|uniref:Methylamine utilisation protein MauE domain-containing protein n=1 Tax=Sphingobacterium yanglingense TaxID=1437280 RepID=A0A4R6W513_9SPHI|nr:MauE/DoxX family redox-associated membrane protein [Sphingobacterium yanglingense]TDQ73824.1 hypothetical protein CLV99_4261 [Sphingobacterium yanglingense]
MKKNIIDFISYSFVALFVFVALSKLYIYNEFVSQIRSQVFPDQYTFVIVWGIILLQLTLAALLLFNKTRLLGLYLSTFLLIAFNVYIHLVISNFYGYMPCSCAGISKHFSWWRQLNFNYYFIVLGIIGIILSHWNNSIFVQRRSKANG